MSVAVESLFLLALLSAFIGLVALLALNSPTARRSPQMRGTLVAAIVAAAVAALGSYLIYAATPHEEARRAVYGEGLRTQR
ncbi:hypothetical protein [Methylocystis parvus]|uniref:Uncharacterized protein n=1 Tax=Methylocystis parvus TaxID=134 RepID=A0A6B8M870_9HYPH|nr:hypothetical protein [Methylocystis parvus]QGM97829.1 hypothetical protein F7D14_10360 [Methylocystis parvus]WBK01862.1 hypothetical protein MMG94_09225 [Methylocystis parvus OBBP]